MKPNKSRTRYVPNDCTCDPVQAVHVAISGEERELCPLHDWREVNLRRARLEWEMELTHRPPQPEPERQPGAGEVIATAIGGASVRPPERHHVAPNSPDLAELVARAFGPNAVVVDSTPDL